jgi:hypothetical protein
MSDETSESLHVQVVSGNQPGQLLLLDLQSKDLYEMRLGLDSQVSLR